ncbi:MAG: hypothetical protein GY827_08855 [Cytophagales bacterium]|nr:hypothetical protein [Cytophagales bacterium]
MFGRKRIQELEERIKAQERALKHKNEYISIQENYISRVVDKANEMHNFLENSDLQDFFPNSSVFNQPKEALSSCACICFTLSQNRKLLLVIDCGDGDAASFFSQTYYLTIFQERARYFWQDLESTLVLKDIESLLMDETGLGAFIIDEGENIQFFVSNISLVITDKNHHFFCQKSHGEFGKIQFFVLNNGVLQQEHHEEKEQKYSCKDFLEFLQKNKLCNSSQIAELWEDELDNWMGCCGEQNRDIFLLSIDFEN